MSAEIARLTRERDEAMKAREEADSYAGRANARIADLGERLDATEAVLRDAEKARKEAERDRGVLGEHYALEIKARHSAESRAARLLTAMKEIRDELGVPQPGYPAPVANAARIADAALSRLRGVRS